LFFILSITSPALALVVGEGAVVVGQTLVEGVVIVVVLIVGGHRGRLGKIVIVTETYQLFFKQFVSCFIVTENNARYQNPYFELNIQKYYLPWLYAILKSLWERKFVALVVKWTLCLESNKFCGKKCTVQSVLLWRIEFQELD